MRHQKDDVTGNQEYLKLVTKILNKELVKNRHMTCGFRYSKKTYKKDIFKRAILIGFYRGRLNQVPDGSKFRIEYQLGRRLIQVMMSNQQIAKAKINDPFIS